MQITLAPLGWSRDDAAQMPIDTTKTYRLSPSLYLKQDGEGLLVLDANAYTVHELNDSAAMVVRLCDGTNSCEDMVVSLVEECGGDAKEAAEVVYRTLVLLDSKDLIECA